MSVSNINQQQQGAVQAQQLANTQNSQANCVQSSASSSLLGALSSGYLTTGYGQAGSSTGISGTTISVPSYGYIGTQPQWGQATYGYHTPVDPNTFSVRKVENGYILSRQGKEYVVTDEKAVEKFLKLARIIL